MSVYDVESYLANLQSYLASTLNTRLSSIDTEKNDSITLRQIDSNAYFLQTMDTGVANYDPYVYYGIQDVESTGIGPATIKKYIIVVAIILADSASDVNIGKRLLRYQRALSEVIEEKYSQLSSDEPVKAKVSSMVPISFRTVDSSESFRAIGVEIEISIV